MYICQKQAEKFEEAWIRFIWLVTMSYQTIRLCLEMVLIAILPG